jgi:A118 family predicted phage portal protein
MFTKILEWIRGVLNKMLSTATVKDALSVDVVISPLMADALEIWSSMYVNQASWLSGDTADKTHSLNLPAAIAAEISRMVTIEFDMEISGSPRADYLYAQFENVEPRLRTMVEYAQAKGGMVFKPYIQGGSVIVDYVQADQFYPVAFDGNGNITAAVFSDTRIVGNYYYTRLEYHTMTPQGCVIKNMAYKSSSKDTLGSSVELAVMDAWANLQPETIITGIDRPLFAYYKTPLANNIDTTSPLGVSCYARAVDLIRQADEQWSKLLWEFESGNRALYVDTLAFGKDSNGKPVLPNKRLYRTLQNGGQIGSDDMFHEWTPTLREANILAGLEAILKRIEYLCGLANGTLSDPNSVALTATEIKSSKQRTFTTITDNQHMLEGAMGNLLYAMDIWATLGNLAPAGKYEAVFYFDDSIVTDHDVLTAQSMQEVAAGLMSKVEYRMVVKGETEEVAQKYLDMINKESKESINLFSQEMDNKQDVNA